MSAEYTDLPTHQKFFFLTELNAFLEFSAEKKIILIGDFNINLLTSSASTESYKTILIANGLVLLIRIDKIFATRVSNTISTLIDHVSTNILDHDRFI